MHPGYLSLILLRFSQIFRYKKSKLLLRNSSMDLLTLICFVCVVFQESKNSVELSALDWEKEILSEFKDRSWKSFHAQDTGHSVLTDGAKTREWDIYGADCKRAEEQKATGRSKNLAKRPGEGVSSNENFFGIGNNSSKKKSMDVKLRSGQVGDSLTGMERKRSPTRNDRTCRNEGLKKSVDNKQSVTDLDCYLFGGKKSSAQKDPTNENGLLELTRGENEI